MVPQDRGVLAALPRSAHPNAQKAIAEITTADSTAHAQVAAQEFANEYGTEWPLAAAPQLPVCRAGFEAGLGQGRTEPTRKDMPPSVVPQLLQPGWVSWPGVKANAPTAEIPKSTDPTTFALTARGGSPTPPAIRRRPARTRHRQEAVLGRIRTHDHDPHRDASPGLRVLVNTYRPTADSA